MYTPAGTIFATEGLLKGGSIRHFARGLNNHASLAEFLVDGLDYGILNGHVVRGRKPDGRAGTHHDPLSKALPTASGSQIQCSRCCTSFMNNWTRISGREYITASISAGENNGAGVRTGNVKATAGRATIFYETIYY